MGTYPKRIKTGTSPAARLRSSVKMKKIFYILLSMLIIVCVISIAAFLCIENLSLSQEDLEILTKQNSGIKNFYIENEKVYIVTGITIKNNTDDDKKFLVIAESLEDYESDLITTPVLQGYDESLSTKEFFINGNETKIFNVIFVGTHGTNNQKADRLIPKLSVQIIK